MIYYYSNAVIIKRDIVKFIILLRNFIFNNNTIITFVISKLEVKAKYSKNIQASFFVYRSLRCYAEVAYHIRRIALVILLVPYLSFRKGATDKQDLSEKEKREGGGRER